MSNIVHFSEKRNNNFKDFINNNKAKVYASTPEVSSISADDEWADETEWDELFQELSVKEN